MQDDVNIFVFGVSDYARACIKTLEEKNIRPAAILDNDPQKQGTVFEGIIVCSPMILKGNDSARVIIACRNFPGVVKQIEGIGVRMENIYLSPKEYVEDVWRENYFENRIKGIVLIANGYDPFTHIRVKKYLEAGYFINVINYREENEDINTYEIDGIKILETGRSGLLYLLRRCVCSGLLVHFMNYRMAAIIELAGTDRLPMVVWSHGYESLPWYRTWFEYSESELEEKISYFTQNDIEKKKFHGEWFKKNNVTWVFVSEWHRDRVKKWVGYLPNQYRVIHNYIDEEYYEIPFPSKESVTNILSIKSHETKTYANDVVAKAIVLLSQRSIFNELRFTLYGFGKLFNDNFKELRNAGFPNVCIIEKKLTSTQMKTVVRDHGLFLGPTRNDSHGVTVAEMMAAGRCVVTSSIPVMLELYDESCVSFCEGDNPWSLADEVEYLVNHRETFLSKCHKARTTISRQCGYRSTIEKELELIEFMRKNNEEV